MPVFEYECKKCGEKTELFVKSSEVTPLCKKCGEPLSRVYSGKVYGATGQKCGKGCCSGDCSKCSGCK